MFIRFDVDAIDLSRWRDAWGYPRILTPMEHARLRESLRFMQLFYYMLIILLIVSIIVIAYLVSARQ